MGDIGIYGRNFAYTIRLPTTALGKTEFKVWYHCLSKAILGKLIHLPGEKIKELYMNDQTRKYERLMEKEPRLELPGLYVDNRSKPVIGGREVTIYINCQDGRHEPHPVKIKSLPLKEDPIIHPSTNTNCGCPDCDHSRVRYTGNDVLLDCKHIEAVRDILNYPLQSDIDQIRVKGCVPEDRMDIFRRVHQVFEPVLNPESEFGRGVIREFIDKYFFEKSLNADKNKGGNTQYECELYFYLKHGNDLLSEKAKESIGYKQDVRCGWEVVKGETGKNKRGVDPVYVDALNKFGYIRAGTVLNVEGNFDGLSLDEKVFELSVPERIVWEQLSTKFDGYVRFIPEGNFQWVRIGLPMADEDFAKKLGDKSDGWNALSAEGVRVVLDSVTGIYSVEMPVPKPQELGTLMEVLRKIKEDYARLKGLNIL